MDVFNAAGAFARVKKRLGEGTLTTTNATGIGVGRSRAWVSKCGRRYRRRWGCWAKLWRRRVGAPPRDVVHGGANFVSFRLVTRSRASSAVGVTNGCASVRACAMAVLAAVDYASAGS